MALKAFAQIFGRVTASERSHVVMIHAVVLNLALPILLSTASLNFQPF